MGEIHFRRKLVSSEVQRIKVSRSDTIQKVVERLDLPIPLHQLLRVHINYLPLDPTLWRSVVPARDDYVQFFLVPAGDNPAKTGLGLLAFVALTVFTYGAGAASLGGLTGFAGGTLQAAQIGVMFAGSLAINALIAPQDTGSTPAGFSDDTTGFNGIAGTRNQVRLYKPVRSVYGRFKVAPDMAATPYIITSGDQQTLYALYDLGYGEVDFEDVRIGETPIGSFNAAQPTAAYKVHKNYTSGPLEYYKNDHHTEVHNVEIDEKELARSVPADADEITIEIAFPRGLGIFLGDGQLIDEICTFDLWLQKKDGSTGKIGINQVRSLTTSHDLYVQQASPYARELTFKDLHKHYLPRYPRKEPGWTIRQAKTNLRVEINGPEYVLAQGVLHPSPIVPGQIFFMDDKPLQFVILTATKVSERQDYVRGTSAYIYYMIETWDITLNRPTETGPKTYDRKYVENEGDGIIYNFVPQYYGGITQKLQSPSIPTPTGGLTIRRAYAKPFVFTITIKLPSFGKWEIFISRDTPPEYGLLGNTRHLDQTKLISIRATTLKPPLAFKVPHTVVELEVVGSDQVSGMIDAVSGMAYRILPLWDGTQWTRGRTSNPSWQALDILRGDANPLPLDDSRIDLESFKKFAQFCDRTAPQGGAYSNCDCNLDGASTVFQRFNEIAAVGRGVLATRENKFSVIWDRFPTTPVQMFTPINSWGFSSTKTFSKIPDALRVSFIDPAAEWQLSSVDVYSTGFDKNNAKYIEQLSFPKVIRREQVQRDAWYFLAVGRLRPEVFSITCDLEALIVERGDLVAVQHDVGRIGGSPTRIVSLPAADQVELHEPFLMAAAKTYFVRIRNRDGSQEEIEVDSAIADNVLKLKAAAPNANVGDLVITGERDHVIDKFLVKKVIPGADLTATLELVPISYDIQTSDTGTIPPYTPAITPDESIYPASVARIDVITEVIYEERFPKYNVLARWESHPGTKLYEVWIAEDGSNNYELVDVTENTEYLIWNKRNTVAVGYPQGKLIGIKIRAVNVIGNKLPLVACVPTYFEAWYDKQSPGKPLFFAGNINTTSRATIMLTWLPPADKDIAGYILRYTTEFDSPSWLRSTIERNLIPFDSSGIEVNVRVGSYLMKTIDTSGNQSKDFALVRTTVPSLYGLDLVEKVKEHDPSSWGGRLMQTEVVRSGVRLASQGGAGTYFPFGTYDATRVIDIGAVYLTRVITSIQAEAAEDVFMDSPPWDPLSKLPAMAVTKPGDWNVEAQIRVSSKHFVMADWVTLDAQATLAGAAQNDWSGWSRVTAGDYTGRYFQFRMVLSSFDARITPHVWEFTIEVDLHERTEQRHDITIAVGGTHIDFSSAYRKAPAVALTQDNANPGDTIVLSNVTAGGFDVEVFDKTDTSVAAQIDFLAVGYGQQFNKIYPAIKADENDALDLINLAAAHPGQRDLLT